MLKLYIYYLEIDDSHEMLGLERDDLEKAAVLYENVRAQRRRKDKKLDKQLADAFVKFLEEKMQRLSHVIVNPNVPKHLKSVHILNVSIIFVNYFCSCDLIHLGCALKK